MCCGRIYIWIRSWLFERKRVMFFLLQLFCFSIASFDLWKISPFIYIGFNILNYALIDNYGHNKYIEGIKTNHPDCPFLTKIKK